MEHVTNWTIILNMWIQLLNLIIFFVVFKMFFAWPIVEAVEKRKKMLNELKNADEILKKKLEEAEREKKSIIEEWLIHKNKLIEESKQEAEQKRKSILEQAEREKNAIIQKWEQQIKSDKEELEKEWEKSVKKWIYTVYEKLVWWNEGFIKQYTDKVVLKK